MSYCIRSLRSPENTQNQFHQSYYLQLYSVHYICKDRERLSPPESVERFIEGQASSPSYFLTLHPPPLPSPDSSSTGDTQEGEKERQFADGRGGGAKFIPRRESLVLYKSVNTLWSPRFSLPGAVRGSIYNFTTRRKRCHPPPLLNG
jgi:hypothetical protein